MLFLSPISHPTPIPSLSHVFLNSSPTRKPRTISLHHHTPSLPKPLSSPSPPSPSTLPRDSFTQTHLLPALRVPSHLCSSLESRLRGHLLNWPRVPNVARAPNDDLDPHLLPLLPRDPPEEFGPLPPVMYREKLAREFNCRGFLRFRNLARMSRPRRKVESGRRRERVKGRVYEVEVVGERDEEEDVRGLLGEEFGGGRWRGPTRLLLLDPKYAGKGNPDLPEAVKAVLSQDTTDSRQFVNELVQCRLTLFYDYWPMNEVLEALLPEGITVPSAFETVGHIAHLNLKEEHLPYKTLIAQVILDKNKAQIQTVVNKVDNIQNVYRTMELEVLAGNHSLVTMVVENGLRFHVDLAKVYWNSRLGTERQRLIFGFSIKDVVCDVFSGVGPIAISAAKKVKRVYANDLNPVAVDYLDRNIVLNKLERKVEVFNMDARRFIKLVFSMDRPHSITQVVMNLPNDAAEFLGAFRGVLSRRRKDVVLPRVHIYGFSKSENPEFDFQERIKVALGVSIIEIEMRRVRLVAPGKWMLCGSFVLPRTVAFDKNTSEF